MSTRQDQINKVLAAQAAAHAATNDPSASQVTPPSTVPVTPTPPQDGAVMSADTSSQGVGGYIAQAITDAPGAVARGAANAVNQTVASTISITDWLSAHLGMDKPDPKDNVLADPRWHIPAEKRAAVEAEQKARWDSWKAGEAIPQSILPDKPKTGVGNVIEGVTSFAVGMIGAGKVMKGLGVATELTGAAKVAVGALKGGIAQYFTQDPQASRLSNLLGDNAPALKAMTDYVSANKDDAPTTARFKSAIEGMGLGLATDALFASAKLVKLNRLWTDAPKAGKAAIDAERKAAMTEIESALNKTGKFKTSQKPDGTWTVESTIPAKPKAAPVSNGKYNGGLQVFEDPIRKAAPVEHPLYRGMAVAPDSPIVGQIKNGEDLTFGVNSFSKDATEAADYAKVNGKNGNTEKIVFELNNGQAIQRPNTNEWLSSGTYKITNTVEKDGVTHVTLEQGETAAAKSADGLPPLVNGDETPATNAAKIASEPAAPSQAPLSFQTQEEASSEAAAMNYADHVQQSAIERPTTEITPEQTSTLNAQIKDLVSPDNPWMGKTEGIDFNLGNVSSDEGSKAALESISQVMRKELDAARGGATLTNDQLKQGVSDLFGANAGDTDQIIADLVKSDVKPNDLPIRLNAGRVLLDKISANVIKASQYLDSNPDSPVAFQTLSKHMSDLVRMAEVTKGRVTSAARATQSGAITTGALGDAVAAGAKGGVKAAEKPVEDLLAKKFLVALPNMTPEQIQSFARKIQMTNGDPATLLKMANLVQNSTDDLLKQPTFWDKMNTLWVNSVLSGPLTSAKNFVGNTIGLGATAPERFTTGLYMGDTKVMQEGADLFTGFFTNMGDSLRAAKNSFMAGKPILESGNQTNEIQNAFQGYLGTAVGVPSRVLMSADEFFKNMAYRSFVRSKALREAAETGLTGSDVTNFVAQKMDDSLAKGVALNNNALAFAQQATFTNPLTPGTVGADLSSFTNKHPAFRFAALPFVKTPTNILLWTWDRTPGIAFALKANREALQAGGERAAEVMARQSTGAVAWGAATYLAYNGTITGGGPKDPAQKKLWLDAGNKPYSLKVGDKRIPFSAGDPLLTPFGIVADIVQASGELKAEDHDNFAMAFTTSLSRNLASKSYLYGLTDFMQAAFDGDTKTLTKWTQNRAGSFVPAVLNQMNPDDTMREMRTYTDQVIGRLPGTSETLPPRVSFFGDPIMKAPFSEGRPVNPFTPSLANKDHHVEDQLLELGRQFAYPDKKYPLSNIDLTSKQYGVATGNLTPYDRMLALMARPGDGIPTLRQVITQVVDDPSWKTMSPGVPGVQEGGTRFDVINQIVQKYRGIAQKKLLMEFPELKHAVERDKVTTKAAEKGGQAGLDAIQGYLNEPSN